MCFICIHKKSRLSDFICVYLSELHNLVTSILKQHTHTRARAFIPVRRQDALVMMAAEDRRRHVKHAAVGCR